MSRTAAVESQYKSYKKLGVNVHKFGGSSLRTSDQIQKVAGFIQKKSRAGDLIVVSANGNVTDFLFKFSLGEADALSDIKDYLCDLAGKLLDESDSFKKSLQKDLNLIQKGWQDNNLTYHHLLAFGELWSVKLLDNYAKEQSVELESLSPELFLRFEDNTLVEKFDGDYFHDFFRRLYANHSGQRYLVPGFIAQDKDGHLITLGRNGSDYTATVIGNLVNAKTVTLWTDVDGIYTADPNIIPEATRLKELSFCEAQALSELGANVLHQKTVNPLLASDIQAFIKSSDLASVTGTLTEGTRVSRDIDPNATVKTITIKNKLKEVLISDISEIEAKNIEKQLLNKQIATYANRYDKSLNRYSLYVESHDLFNCTSVINALQHYSITSDYSSALVSIVGQNIRQDRKLISNFLERIEKFDIELIYYPSNHHSICVIIDDEASKPLLSDLHSYFFSQENSIPLVVLGYGNIGKQFIKIFKSKKEAIEKEIGRKVTLKAIANSRSYAFSQTCLTENNSDPFDQISSNGNGELYEELKAYKGKELIVLDLTASSEVSERYLDFAENQWHIISANKIAPSNKDFADKVKSKLRLSKRHWLTNTTAGAGLPIQSAIKLIKESGDEITEISGIFSGSLSWLFGQFDGTSNFMDLLEVAKSNAFTEPDPREDLSGNDVIRKIRILAGEADFTEAEEDFEPAIPNEFLEGTEEDFWAKAEPINEYVDSLYQEASSNNGVLRYIATINAKKVELKLVSVTKDHAFANLNPCDNIFSIKSHWYSENPLIIQGPGAGREVTAAGVLNDLFELLRRL